MISMSAAAAPGGTVERNERSQMLRSARPCAVLARRPTVHMMAASSWSSRSAIDAGSRCASSTNGSVVDANEERDRGKKEEKEVLRGLCARNDSRPLLNANEPTGSCESDNSSRKCVENVSGAESCASSCQRSSFS